MSGQERWEPLDVALAADGAIWLRTDAGPPGTVWRIGGVGAYWSEDQPLRPLTLLVRNGQPCSGILTAEGEPVPVWVVKASTAALDGQLAYVVAEHRALRAGLRSLHRKVETGPDAGHCDSCGFAYPCHTIRLLDARPEDKADQLRASYESFEARAAGIEWRHFDGSPCPETINDQLLPPDGGLWWCPTHQQSLVGTQR